MHYFGEDVTHDVIPGNVTQCSVNLCSASANVKGKLDDHYFREAGECWGCGLTASDRLQNHVVVRGGPFGDVLRINSSSFVNIRTKTFSLSLSFRSLTFGRFTKIEYFLCYCSSLVTWRLLSISIVFSQCPPQTEESIGNKYMFGLEFGRLPVQFSMFLNRSVCL